MDQRCRRCGGPLAPGQTTDPIGVDVGEDGEATVTLIHERGGICLSYWRKFSAAGLRGLRAQKANWGGKL